MTHFLHIQGLRGQYRVLALQLERHNIQVCVIHTVHSNATYATHHSTISGHILWNGVWEIDL